MLVPPPPPPPPPPQIAPPARPATGPSPAHVVCAPEAPSQDILDLLAATLPHEAIVLLANPSTLDAAVQVPRAEPLHSNQLLPDVYVATTPGAPLDTPTWETAPA